MRGFLALSLPGLAGTFMEWSSYEASIFVAVSARAGYRGSSHREAFTYTPGPGGFGSSRSPSAVSRGLFG